MWNPSDWRPIRLPLTLSPGIVHIIRVPLDVQNDRLEAMTNYLSSDELKRAARFRFNEPRSRFVTCRAALRELIGNCCGMEPNVVSFLYGPHGKPALLIPENRSSPEIEFSVSHSGQLGLIAITVGSPVGVDIEELNPAVQMLKLAKRFFAEAESTELSNLPLRKQMAGFYRGWTCKEAYIKATGRGFSLPLSSFCVVMDPDLPASLRHVADQPDEPERWMVQAIDAGPNYAAAVMATRPNSRIEFWDW
jgi:4'-phosphopantetheinyl transferase